MCKIRLPEWLIYKSDIELEWENSKEEGLKDHQE
jgi:hypothetical protein